MQDDTGVEALSVIPGWVPEGARLYLTHVEGGVTIRGLARAHGVHASTVMRQVRRFEARRDDPLVDKALRRLAANSCRAIPCEKPAPRRALSKEPRPMIQSTTATQNPTGTACLPADDPLLMEAHRALHRLCETGAVMAIAADMEMAVVVRNGSDGSSTRTAAIDRAVAEAMALKDWITCTKQGRISRYEVTAAGRAALKDLALDEDADADPADTAVQVRRMRYGATESPLASLARRRDKSGLAFLSEDLVTAGERLREDFELGQVGPYLRQSPCLQKNWQGFVAGAGPAALSQDTLGVGPDAARQRVREALVELGPGLADVALRCCCFLEGLEVTEKRMGWSARSGKIVLRIALQRLRQHYGAQQGDYGQMIG